MSFLNHGLAPWKPTAGGAQVELGETNFSVPVETSRGNYTHFLIYTRSSNLVIQWPIHRPPLKAMGLSLRSAALILHSREVNIPLTNYWLGKRTKNFIGKTPWLMMVHQVLTQLAISGWRLRVTSLETACDCNSTSDRSVRRGSVHMVCVHHRSNCTSNPITGQLQSQI